MCAALSQVIYLNPDHLTIKEQASSDIRYRKDHKLQGYTGQFPGFHKERHLKHVDITISLDFQLTETGNY